MFERQQEEVRKGRREQANVLHPMLLKVDDCSFQKLVEMYQGHMWRELMTVTPGTDEARRNLSMAQGVNDFAEWMRKKRVFVQEFLFGGDE